MSAEANSSFSDPDSSGRIRAELGSPVAGAPWEELSGRCSWCGAAVAVDEGFRVYEAAGERRATFCRLEHVVPWVIQGPHWEPGALADPPPADSQRRRRSHCDAELGDGHVLCVRHRGDHRIADDFCSVDDLSAWAKAGGRWR